VKKRAICVDIDNVVARTDAVLRRAIKLYSRAGVDLRYEDVVEFDYWKCRDRSGRCFERDEWTHIHLQFTVRHLMEIEPFAGVQAHLEELSREFEVHLATSRLPEGREATLEWLRRHDIPYGEIHFVPHRGKHDISREFAAAVEDDLEQARLFGMRGVPVFLLAHPWNVVTPEDSLPRLNDWPALVDSLTSLPRQ